jgi:hypothetical protein
MGFVVRHVEVDEARITKRLDNAYEGMEFISSGTITVVAVGGGGVIELKQPLHGINVSRCISQPVACMRQRIHPITEPHRNMLACSRWVSLIVGCSKLCPTEGAPRQRAVIPH